MDALTALLTLYALSIAASAAIVWIFRGTNTPTSPWIATMIILPIAGFVLYIFYGEDLRKRQLFQLKERRDRERLEELVGEQRDRLLSDRCEIGGLEEYRDIIALLLNSGNAYLTRGNDIRIISDGGDKFESMYRAIDAATDHVHMEYYLIRPDEEGRKLLDVLAARAREGIQVRLLYDAVGTRLPGRYFRGLEAAGGLVAPFFPSLLSSVPVLNAKVNFRDHRKIVVVDGRIGLIGGFNIGREYLGRDPRIGYWRDTDLRIEGPAVRAMQLRFILDWGFASGEELSLSPRLCPAFPRTADGAAVQIVSGGPDCRWDPIKDAYLKLVSSARRSIYIQTPYFVPDQSITDALRIAARSGVDVRIMIPGRPDHPFVYWASRAYLGELLGTGVRGYTYDNGFLHAKTVVVDGAVTSIGSANWDIRSFRLNFETNAFVYDRRVAGEQERTFLADMERSTELTLEAYQRRPSQDRIKEGVARYVAGFL